MASAFNVEVDGLEKESFVEPQLAGAASRPQLGRSSAAHLGCRRSPP